jgi:Tfp pilus assembly protein PilP
MNLVQAVVVPRMCRRQTSPWQRLAQWVCCLGGGLSLAMAAGWWCRVATAHAALQETREATRVLAQQLGESPATDTLSVQPDRDLADWHPVALSAGDVSALVRWHALLRTHQLSDWQGRSMPAPAGASADSATPESGGWAVWQLEGPATYEQGVSLLNALVREFPRLVLLHVQVQQMPSTDTLHWRLELRWSAPLSALAQRWPMHDRKAATPGINPFAWGRLPSDARSAQASDVNQDHADQDLHHVLSLAPLKEIRLIGVVAQGGNRVALVHWPAAPPQLLSQGGRATTVPTAYRLRVGNSLGLEKNQVVAIEARALVLMPWPQSSPGGVPGRREVLALTQAPMPLSTQAPAPEQIDLPPPSGERHRP